MNCCNCNRSAEAQNVYHVLDMGPEIIDVIEQWRNDVVFDGDSLCQECLDQVLIELDKPCVVSNVNHCICCDISLLRPTKRRSRLIPVGKPERIYIAQVIHPRQVPADARVCNRCWQRAHHYRDLVLPEQEAVEPDPLVAQPEPEQAAEPVPAQAAEPVPAQAAEPVPAQAAEPVPAQAAEPVPAQAAEPVPAQAAEPVPAQAAEAVPAQAEQEVGDAENVVQTIDLHNYCRTPNTPVHRFVPECGNSERQRVPIYIKKKLLTEKKVYVTEGARICAVHAATHDWDFLDEYEFTSHSFTNRDIEKMLKICQNNDNIIDFENIANVSDQVCRYWTGLTVLIFLALFHCVDNYLTTLVKKPKKALGVYLVKIRTGDSFARIASVFAISQSMAQSYVKKVRDCLKEHYVPLHLGLQHITRADISNRTLLIPQGLFGTEARNPITICDGSYIYMQKSSNYFFQKKSYSLHKYRNLVKPMMFVTTDGHIIDVYGPYAATDSDADIMNSLFRDETSELRQFYQENDIFILDRGFRDAIEFLLSLGYTVCKPHSLDVGERQLSTRQANESRLVTMCRWVVEIVNGRFKRDYKIFRTEYFNRMGKNLITDFRIAAAIINNFHPVITDRIDAQLILDRALQRRFMDNYLADFVIERQLNRRRAPFVNVDSQIPSLDVFPTMLMSELILFCLGTYQLKQARSYYGEHIRANGTFSVEVSTDLDVVQIPNISAREPVLIRGRIKSRHHSQTVYFTYILLDTTTNNWEESICGYYCSCIIGKRTVGSCAHVATIVWYLGWARYQDNINPPATFLDGILVRDDF